MSKCSYLSPEPLLQDPNWVRRELKAGHQVLPYGYARNNPARYVDADRFPTLSQAAIEAWLLLQQGGAAVANGVRSGGDCVDCQRWCRTNGGRPWIQEGALSNRYLCDYTNPGYRPE